MAIPRTDIRVLYRGLNMAVMPLVMLCVIHPALATDGDFSFMALTFARTSGSSKSLTSEIISEITSE